MKKSILLRHLPKVIKVKVIKGESGCFIAELPKYDVFTEADSLLELEWNVNDLIYTLFDVPKKYHGKIWYRPAKRRVKDLAKVKIPYPFQRLLASDLLQQHYLR